MVCPKVFAERCLGSLLGRRWVPASGEPFKYNDTGGDFFHYPIFVRPV